jgi:hypothetical protein
MCRLFQKRRSNICGNADASPSEPADGATCAISRHRSGASLSTDRQCTRRFGAARIDVDADVAVFVSRTNDVELVLGDRVRGGAVRLEWPASCWPRDDRVERRVRMPLEPLRL